MPPARGRDGLLLYVDFDGVLHHENTIFRPRKGAFLVAPAGLLAEILAPYPTVEIAFSTSWGRL